ncbi:MAG: aminotransferase class III-fold pyridoxal phosphate-dependent enzyme [Candidatus Aenigmarchaeota archaeon]|nr:aminotransferase class III-fold pyridoxal phosphate-dependent enzyme [Candidatus Aenigmarchaeota archaeon]
MAIKFVCSKPGKKSVKIIRRDDRVMSPSFTREYSFVFKRARGCYIWDVDGRRHLDFAAGIAVMGIGHSNPAVGRAVKDQLKMGTHVGFSDFYAELPVEFVEYAMKFLPKHLDTAFLSNSGTESVEAAYKMARWHTKKKWAVAFKPSFHGRTMGSLSMTNSRPVQRDRFGPFLPVKHSPYPYCYRCPFEKGDHEHHKCTNNYLSELRKTMLECRGDLAAIFFEPISGEGGYIVPPKDFVRGMRELCDEHGVLLCDDEVQSGCYRTGKFLAIENFGVKPDVVSLSKAIGGGVPLGLTVANRKTMDWVPGSHANTFGGNLLACAAGMATLKFMKEKRLGENAQKIGGYIMKRLERTKRDYDIVGDVRGMGLMIGLEIVSDKASKRHGESERSNILCKASEKGLLLLPAGRSAIRICPPLVINKSQAKTGIDILEDAISESC